MKKNDFLLLDITDTDRNGYGIAHSDDGMVILVKNGCKGDRVQAKIIKVAKSYAVAIITEILQPSVDRFTDGCPVSDKCGGCVFQHITYEAECNFKKESINNAFERIAKSDLRLTAFHGAKSITSYRNKAIYPVSRDTNGNIISGFYAQMSHRIVTHDRCYISDDIFCEIRDFILSFIKSNNIPVYDESNQNGLIRSIYFRKSAENNSVILTLIMNGKKLINDKTELKFCAEIINKFPQICSILINVNTKNSNGVLGDKWRTLYGDGYLTDTILGKKLRISPASFYQVNHQQTELLYSIAKKYANLGDNETLLDLYCGTGTVGICIANNTTKLIGVEIVQQATKDAEYNAKVNRINGTFICLNAENALDDISVTSIKPDVITIDPPRKGCGIEAVRKIASLDAKRIIYISCDPATLARDLAEFSGCGYTAVKAEGVDMFPRTGHVETVVLLQRQNT